VITGNGVFVTAGSATLGGTLYVNVSGFDGNTVILLQAGNITGQWDDIVLQTGTSSECIVTSADVTYTTTQVTLQVLTIEICALSSALLLSFVLLFL
jgi:hypothetical protein